MNKADNSSVRILYERPITRCRKSVFNESFEILDDGSLRIEGSMYDYRRYCINHVETLEPGELAANNMWNFLTDDSRFTRLLLSGLNLLYIWIWTFKSI